MKSDKEEDYKEQNNINKNEMLRKIYLFIRWIF